MDYVNSKDQMKVFFVCVCVCMYVFLNKSIQ